MGSNRLPGKVLADLAGRPVLAWIVRAAQSTLGIDATWVATSGSFADDPIAEWCNAAAVPCHRGSEHDVLERFAGAIEASGAEIIVRLTADCPLLDPSVIAQALRLRTRFDAEYTSNVDPATWPDGLDCEVVTARALLAAAREATRPGDREHVTPFVRRNHMRFPSETLVCPLPGLAAERWTLDTPADFSFLSEIAPRLPTDRAPSYLEVLHILDQSPHLRGINRTKVQQVGQFAAATAARIDGPAGFARSEQFLSRAERVIPLAAQTFSKSKIQFPPGAAPHFVTHGNGGKVYDVDGNEYVDLVSALLPNVLGYCDPDVDFAIRRQLSRGISFSLATPLETELSERLVRHIPCAEMVRFGKNGTDATSAAVRLARAATRRDRLMLLGYHGWQDWYIGATTRNLGVPASVSALSHLAPFGDLAAAHALLKSHPDQFAAIVLEPAGATEPPAGYLEGLRDLAHHHGALLIFDEVITGFRWSLGGAQARYKVTPDLACFGKAMGNGMPISAVVGRADIMRLMEDIFYSGTFGGEALSIAAAIATIDKIERENVIDRLWEVGGYLMEAVRAKIAAKGLSDIIGLVGSAPWAILTYRDHATASKEAIKTLFLREMIAAGVLINASHNVCFAHTSVDIGRVLAAYDIALDTLSASLKKGEVDSRIGNQVIRPIFSVRAAS